MPYNYVISAVYQISPSNKILSILLRFKNVIVKY